MATRTKPPEVAEYDIWSQGIERRLYILASEISQHIFDGHIPVQRVIVEHIPIPNDAPPEYFTAAEVDTDNNIIRIDTTTILHNSSRTLIQALIHEMCHIEVLMKYRNQRLRVHGKVFWMILIKRMAKLTPDIQKCLEEAWEKEETAM